jgi:hypothetical protein
MVLLTVVVVMPEVVAVVTPILLGESAEVPAVVVLPMSLTLESF